MCWQDHVAVCSIRQLASCFPEMSAQIAALPRAKEILILGERELREGRGGSAL